MGRERAQKFMQKYEKIKENKQKKKEKTLKFIFKLQEIHVRKKS